jgi:hypothetical protein
MKKQVSKRSAAKTEDGLNQKQEQFCQLYVGQKSELFGNGTQCYLEVYGWYDENDAQKTRRITYQTAMVNASRLLSNAKIIARINELLETGGFNDENVDKQHLFLINQFADLKTKIAAIREYNELKSRIQKKIDITSGGKPIGTLIDEISGNNNN